MHLGYRCLSLITGKIYISRDVIFDEHVFPLCQNTNCVTSLTPTNVGILGPSSIFITPSSDSSTPIDLTVDPTNPFIYSTVTNSTTTHVNVTIDPVNPCYSPPPISNLHPPVDSSHLNSPISQSMYPSLSNTILITPPSSPPQNLKSLNNIYSQTQPVKPTAHHPLPTCFLASKADILEQTTHDQALQDPYWTQAMHDEYQALMDNHTWSLFPKNSTMNVTGYRWIFKLKLKLDGSIDRYKARLVAKGYKQEDRFDYMETFSPIVKITTIRLLISIAISHHWHIHQLDVSTTFLHGDLTEHLYMSQPPSFINPQFPN